MVDQHVQENIAAILEQGTKKPVTLAALQGFINELTIQQFGRVIGQQAGDFGRQPFTKQGASRSRLIEQTLE